MSEDYGPFPLTNAAIVSDPVGRGDNDGGEGAAKSGTLTFAELTQSRGVNWDQEMRARALEAERIAAFTKRIIERLWWSVGIPKDVWKESDPSPPIRTVTGEAVTVTPQQPKPLLIRAPDANTNGQGSP